MLEYSYSDLIPPHSLGAGIPCAAPPGLVLAAVAMIEADESKANNPLRLASLNVE